MDYLLDSINAELDLEIPGVATPGSDSGPEMDDEAEDIEHLSGQESQNDSSKIELEA